VRIGTPLTQGDFDKKKLERSAAQRLPEQWGFRPYGAHLKDTFASLSDGDFNKIKRNWRGVQRSAFLSNGDFGLKVPT